MSIVIVVGACLFILIRFFAGRYQNVIQNSLRKVGEIQNLTVEEICTALESLNAVKDIHQMVKLGIISGSEVVVSPQFLSYLTNYHPETPRLTTYIIFLYSTIYGGQSDVYRYFLHLLSIDCLPFSSMFYLYQSIYAYMQVSQELSPLIARDLANYRHEFVTCISREMEMWNPINSDSAFSEIMMTTMKYKNVLMTKLLRLSRMYPFSPSVHFELSMGYSDIAHNIPQAAYHFREAVILSDGGSALALSIGKRFRELMPFFKDKTQTGEDTYTFLSSRNDNDRARRKLLPLPTHDKYLQAIGHVFELPKTDLSPTIKPFTRYMITLRACLVLLVVWLLVVTILDSILSLRFQAAQREYEYNLDFMKQTIKFRMNVLSAYYDSLLLLDYYENVSYDLMGELGDLDESLYFKYLRNLLTNSTGLMRDYRIWYSVNFPSQSNSEFFLTFSKMFIMIYQFTRTDHVTIDDYPKFRSQLTEHIMYLRTIIVDVYNQTSNEQIDLYHNVSQFMFTIANTAMIVTVLTMIVIMIISSVITRHIIKSVIAVFKTIQPSVKESIRNQLSQLLRLSDVQSIGEITVYPIKVDLVVSYAFAIIIPIVTIVLYIIANTITTTNTESELIAPSDLSKLEIYRLQALLHFHAIWYNSSSLFYLSSNASASPHALMEHEVGNIFEIRFFTMMDGSFINILATTMITITLVFMVSFVIRTFYYDRTLDNIHSMFHFIPHHIMYSNPAIVQLIDSRSIDLKLMKNYIKIGQTMPKDCQLFIALQIDSDGKVWRTFGDIESVLGALPGSLTDLLGLLMDHDLVEPFLLHRSPTPIYIRSVHTHRELQLKFICYDQLSIFDETQHGSTSQVMRQLARLNNSPPPSTPPSYIEHAIVICIAGSVNERIFTDFITATSLHLFETRNGVHSFGGEFSAQVFHAVQSFIEHHRLNFSNAKITIAGGHSIVFYPPGGSRKVLYPRCIGEDYSTAKNMILKCHANEVLILPQLTLDTV